MNSRRGSLFSLIFGVLAVVLLVFAASAGAVSNKFVQLSTFGREVNLTQVNAHAGVALEDVCTLESRDTCQPGRAGEIPGGFINPEGVAVGPGPSYDVYVADRGNHRVQVFTPSGVFVSMFGWGVNETKSGEAGRSQEEKDVCTSASGDKCRAGQTPAQNGVAEEIASPTGIAVDQGNGDVYVYDDVEQRVEAYTATGQLVSLIGGDVNKTKTEAGAPEAERNVCVAKTADVCQVGTVRQGGTRSHGSFAIAEPTGNDLAIGGPAGSELLYFGEWIHGDLAGRVQELEPDGRWVGEVSLPSSTGSVKGVVVDSSGDAYVAYESVHHDEIREYGPRGEVLKEFSAAVAGQGAANIVEASVEGLALDQYGRLAAVVVIAINTLTGQEVSLHRVLLDPASGTEIGELVPPGEMALAFGLAFNANDELYAAQGGAFNQNDIQIDGPIPVAQPVTGACKNRTGTSVTLMGEINPRGVSETMAWFQYGSTGALGSSTPAHSVATTNADVPVEALMEGLEPNRVYEYRLAGEDANYHPAPGEQPLFGETLSCETAFVAPSPEGEPVSSNVSFSSAVLFGDVNPENAQTKYGFEYGACESLEACPGKQRTPALESSQYAAVGAMQSVSELQPATTYRYRLYAESENRLHTQTASAQGVEGSFTTLAAPSPSASTGPVSGVSASSAVLSGSVDPGGAGATWSFQVGVYNPAGTVFTTVVSGATGTQAGAEAQEFLLSGLQPGTVYAYRIVIQSAYTPDGEPLVGETVLFTTRGLPSVLVVPAVLPLLAVQQTSFPVEEKVTPRTVKCRKGTVRSTAGKCVKSRTRKRSHGTVRSKKSSAHNRNTNKRRK